jgi:putative phosphoesterase
VDALSVRLAVLSDVHGNLAALEAVLEDVERSGGVDAWWVLGDLVALGPEPVEVLERLLALPHATFTQGNTDRYVLTGDLPAIGDPVRSAASFGWTRGMLTAGGWLDRLDNLPLEVRLTLPDGTRVLGVHASPGRDDGLGIRAEQGEAELDALLAGADAELVFVGHTHRALEREHRGIRLVNLGSLSLPPQSDDPRASYALLGADPSGHRVERRRVPYDYTRVVEGIRRVRPPDPEFLLGFFPS